MEPLSAERMTFWWVPEAPHLASNVFERTLQGWLPGNFLVSPSSVPESSTAFPFRQLPLKFNCHSRTISCLPILTCITLPNFSIQWAQAHRLQQDLTLSLVCMKGALTFISPQCSQHRRSACFLHQSLLDSSEFSILSVASACYYIPLILVNNSLLNFLCLISCVILVFCLHQWRFFIFQYLFLLIVFLCLPCLSMDLFVKIHQKINIFILPRAGDMKECATWFQISDSESAQTEWCVASKKTILPVHSSSRYQKNHVDQALCNTR